LHLKTNYIEDMEKDLTWTGSGSLFKSTINKLNYKTISKLDVLDTPYFVSRGLPSSSYTASTNSSIAIRAFDGDHSTYWSNSTGGSTHWLKVNLDDSYIVTEIRFLSIHSDMISSCVLSGSNDDINYINIFSFVPKSTSSEEIFKFVNNNAYKFYRLTINKTGLSTFIHINSIDLISYDRKKFLFQDGTEIKSLSRVNNPYAISFAGAGDARPSTAITFGTNFTVEFWMNVSTLYDYGSPFGYEGNVGFTSYADGRFAFNIGNGSWGTPISSLAGTIFQNRWYHVAGTYNGASTQLFINGVNVGSASNTVSVPNCLAWIGARNNNGNRLYPFIGIVDEVRIWNRALTITEVNDVMSRKVANNEEGLVHYWKFDEGTGTTSASFSGNTLSLNGATWTTTTPPYQYQKEWITIGTVPITQNMFITDGMDDLSIIDNDTIQQLASPTPVLLCWTDNNTAPNKQTKITAIPHPKLILPLVDLDIKGVVQNLNLLTNVTGSAILRVVASSNAGMTWKSYKSGVWNIVDITNLSNIKDNGMTAEELNSLDESKLLELSPNGKFRLAYYLEQNDLDEQLLINSLSSVEKITTSTPTLNSLTIIYDELDKKYSGLMFMDTLNQYYSTSFGEILKYLDMGTLIAGQTSFDVKVKLTNTYPFDVQNVQLWAEHNIEGLTVEFSKTNNPFIGEQSLTYNQRLNFDEVIEFYIRLTVDPTAKVGGNFDIRVTAEKA
jgi:hypothetical protein